MLHGPVHVGVSMRHRVVLTATWLLAGAVVAACSSSYQAGSGADAGSDQHAGSSSGSGGSCSFFDAGQAQSGDDGCQQQPTSVGCNTCCEANHSSGSQTIAATLGPCACNAGGCGSACPTSCPYVSGSSHFTESAGCTQCFNNAGAPCGSCYASLAGACSGNPDCVALFACLETYCTQ